MSPLQSSSNSTGTFTLLLFASASSYAGDIESLSLPAPTTLRQIFTHLESQFPDITKKILRSSGVSVNLEYVDFEVDELDGESKGKGGDAGAEEEGEVEGQGEGLDMVIRAGDEVGIIPPVSSG